MLEIDKQGKITYFFKSINEIKTQQKTTDRYMNCIRYDFIKKMGVFYGNVTSIKLNFLRINLRYSTYITVAPTMKKI